MVENTKAEKITDVNERELHYSWFVLFLEKWWTKLCSSTLKYKIL